MYHSNRRHTLPDAIIATDVRFLISAWSHAEALCGWRSPINGMREANHKICAIFSRKVLFVSGTAPAALDAQISSPNEGAG